MENGKKIGKKPTQSDQLPSPVPGIVGKQDLLIHRIKFKIGSMEKTK